MNLKLDEEAKNEEQHKKNTDDDRRHEGKHHDLFAADLADLLDFVGEQAIEGNRCSCYRWA